MKLQELNVNELKNVNGGGLLGDNMFKGLLEGYVGVQTKDDDGDEESTMINFGLGSIFQNED